MNNKIQNNIIKENKINGSKISTKLSKEQRDAVFSNNRNLLVTAGPGSGYHYFYVKNKNVSYNVEDIRDMEDKDMRVSPSHGKLLYLR